MSVYLNKVSIEKTDFLVGFDVAAPGDESFEGFSGSFKELFDDASGIYNFERNDKLANKYVLAGWGCPELVSLSALFDEKSEILVDNELTIEMQVKSFVICCKHSSTFSSF